MINVLKDLASVTISSDSPSYDGYEPDKLLSYSGRGYMPERFIKPPVNLTVTFPCSIRLNSVVINNTLGSFTSTGIEVLSYGVANDRSPDKSPVFKRIGKCANCRAGVISFEINLPQYNGIQHGNSETSENQKFSLFSYDHLLLKFTRILVVRIFQTKSGLVPVIGSLDIYGQPLSNKFIKSTFKQSSVERAMDFPNSSLPTINSALEHTSPLIKAEKQVPDEFLDPLTQEVMVLPVILPSGYTIDQSSLDKHIRSEESWGRKPSDPYTGVPLSDTNKPIFNMTLKQRIDHYVLTKNVRIDHVSGFKRKAEPEVPTDGSKKKCSDIENSEKLDTQPTQKILKSVDNKLAKILNNTKQMRTITLPEVNSFCMTCKALASSSILYKLSCDHLMCRNCMDRKKLQLICSLCNVETSISDIKRYHAPLL